MQASRLRNGISYGLLLFFAVVLARGITAFASSLVLGAFFRLVLLPLIVLIVLLVAVQTWEQGRGIPRFSLSTVAFILPLSLLAGVLIIRFGEALNLVSVSVLVLVIVCYFLSLYFIIVGKDHYAFLLFMLSMPAIDFVEWDIGKRWELFNLSIGQIRLSIKGAHIFIISLFGVWAATKVLKGKFSLAGSLRYLPVVLLLFYSLVSFLLITSTHNQDQALRFIFNAIFVPLLLYIMIVETIDTEDKLYLIVYSAIAMVILYTLLTHYMSYRTMGVTYHIKDLSSTYGLVKYGTGSPTYNGVLLALVAPLVIALYISIRNSRYVLLSIGLIAFVIIGQIMAFNRGAQLAMLAGAACMLRNRRVQLFAILVLIITAVFWEPIYNFLLVRFHDIHSLDDLTLQNLSHSRYQGWIAAIGMIHEEPILGVGLKNFNDYSHLFSAPFWAVSIDGESHLAYMQGAHNLFLTITSELGLVGLGILLWFLGILLFDLLKGLSGFMGGKLEPLGWGFLGVYVASVVICIAGGGFWSVKSSLSVNILFWTLFALMGRLRWVGNQMNSGTIAED